MQLLSKSTKEYYVCGPLASTYTHYFPICLSTPLTLSSPLILLVTAPPGSGRGAVPCPRAAAAAGAAAAEQRRVQLRGGDPAALPGEAEGTGRTVQTRGHRYNYMKYLYIYLCTTTNAL